MKKTICMILTVCMVMGLTACGAVKQEAVADKDAGFKPSLDASSSCHITVVGGYDNFEALEDRDRKSVV